MKIVIIGAGLAGSIAAGALSAYDPIVLESGPANSGGLSRHYAVMRMRSLDIAKYLGCDAEKVQVHKSVYLDGKLWGESDVTMNNLYSMKLYGRLGSRSLGELGVVDRYLVDYSQVKPKGVRYDNLVYKIAGGYIFDKAAKSMPYDVCISTIPMPAIAKVCRFDGLPKFESRKIIVATAELNVESTVHQTVYFPSPQLSIYRATIQGRKFMVESVSEWSRSSLFYDEMDTITSVFGLGRRDVGRFDFNTQPMGKMVPIDDDVRRHIILSLTRKFDIYSFGRFAIWKPIRADHLAQDIEMIKQFMRIGKVGRQYESRKQM